MLRSSYCMLINSYYSFEFERNRTSINRFEGGDTTFVLQTQEFLDLI